MANNPSPPQQHRPILAQCTAPCRGTVRIVKRDPASNKTTSVVVRVCPSDRRVTDDPPLGMYRDDIACFVLCVGGQCVV